MTDPASMSSGLGVESVEWFTEGGENITVRVTGRWRKRRPTWTGRPLLVIEAHGRRHRFPAIPEPPSLEGPTQGTWRMNFSIPAALAPHLRGHAWLKLGLVVMPLPVEVEAAEVPVVGDAPAAPVGDRAAEVTVDSDDLDSGDLQPGPGDSEPETGSGEPRPAGAEPESVAEPDPVAGPAPAVPGPPDVSAERRLRSAEVALEASRLRLTDADRLTEELSERIEQLEVELADARREPERLNAVLAERERRRRAAEQRAYAERALREDLEQELAARETELTRTAELREQLAAQEARVRALEEELELARRRVDEAEQEAVSARVSRARAERRAAELETQRESDLAALGPGRAALHSGMQAELALAHVAPTVALAPVPRPPGAADVELLASEREMAVRGRAEAAEARAAKLEQELSEQATRVTRALAAIEELRSQLEAVRAERARELLTAPPAEPVDPERLAEALLRLRAETPPAEGAAELESDAAGAETGAAPPPAEGPTAPAPLAPSEPATVVPRATKPWLERVFRRLTEQDASAAGLLALGLLPALRLVESEPFAFDLILAELGCVRVTVAPRGVAVEHSVTPRGRDETSFRVVGDVRSFARLLAAGRVRRRIGRGVAAVEGDRAALRPLLGLLRTPLHLFELRAAGVDLDPWLALSVVAQMIRPRWTKQERFILAHEERGKDAPGTFLHVRDGEPLHVSHREPLGPVATTIVCQRAQLLAAFAADDHAEIELRGEERPMELLRGWVKRAQSD